MEVCKDEVNQDIDRVYGAASRVTLRHHITSLNTGDDSNLQRAQRILLSSSRELMDTALSIRYEEYDN
jgi:hypothetical protein